LDDPLFWTFVVDVVDVVDFEEEDEDEDLGGRRSFPRLSEARKTLRTGGGEEEDEKKEEK